MIVRDGTASILPMPLGIEVLPLNVMSWGLTWVIAVAKWTSQLSGAAGGVRMAPASALLLVVVGF